MVRPNVEFGNSVWCPVKLGDIEEIEKIKKRATKLIISLNKRLCYGRGTARQLVSRNSVTTKHPI